MKSRLPHLLHPSVQAEIEKRALARARAWDLAPAEDPGGRPSSLTRHYCIFVSKAPAGKKTPGPGEDVICEALLGAHLAQEARGPRAQRAQALLWEMLLPRVRLLAGGYERRARACRGMTPDDLLQEGFLKFRAVIGRYQPRRAFLWAWLRKILQRHFWCLVRRSAKCWEQAGPEWSPPTSSHGAVESDCRGHDLKARDLTPPQALAHSDLRQAIDEVCAEVLREGQSAECLAAFRARYLEEKRLREIAAELRRSVSWVHQAIARTLQAFRARFTERYAALAF